MAGGTPHHECTTAQARSHAKVSWAPLRQRSACARRRRWYNTQPSSDARNAGGFSPSVPKRPPPRPTMLAALRPEHGVRAKDVASGRKQGQHRLLRVHLATGAHPSPPPGLATAHATTPKSMLKSARAHTDALAHTHAPTPTPSHARPRVRARVRAHVRTPADTRSLAGLANVPAPTATPAPKSAAAPTPAPKPAPIRGPWPCHRPCRCTLGLRPRQSRNSRRPLRTPASTSVPTRAPALVHPRPHPRAYVHMRPRSIPHPHLLSEPPAPTPDPHRHVRLFDHPHTDLLAYRWHAAGMPLGLDRYLFGPMLLSQYQQGQSCYSWRELWGASEPNRWITHKSQTTLKTHKSKKQCSK